MHTVTISPDFHVEIPVDVRQSLNLRPGQELSIFVYNGRIAMIPVHPIEKMRGFLKGMDSEISRDDADRV
jgi:AbrB family looped-hinge helix DNA binding protein